MLTADAVAFFKTQAALAAALGIKPPSVSDWGETVPPLRQIQLERITDGALKASPDVFDKKPANGDDPAPRATEPSAEAAR